MTINLIWAQGMNGELGLNGQLPWHIPTDLKRFKDITEHHVVIMGRKTFESIGKPLPNRVNVVLTRDTNWKAPDGVFVYTSRVKLLNDIRKSNVFVIGGSEIYKAFLPSAEFLFVTKVHGTFEADTYAPEIPARFRRIHSEEVVYNSDKLHNHTFEIYTDK